MKTAALLPTPGDPFLVRHWLHNCERMWRNEVDEVRVLVGGQTNEEARKYIAHHVERIGGIYTERITGGLVTHGDALGILISDTDADIVLLMEDDVRVRHTGRIEPILNGIRTDVYDVAASPRGGMSGGLEAAAREKWPRQIMDDLGDGHGMWPAFVFAKRECLLSTDRNYGACSWGMGETVPGLGYTVPGEDEAIDTLGSVAFQLRDRFRIHDVCQWKGPWLWSEYLKRQNDVMAWFHCGSLSSSNNLGSIEPPVFAYGRRLTDKAEIGEWAHRLHWWRRCLRLHGDELPEFAERYRVNWERLRERMGVPVREIDAWDKVVDRMVTWDEH